MAVIKTITPVHVGTGREYLVVAVKDGYVFSLDKVIAITSQNSGSLLRDLTDKKNFERAEFFSRVPLDRKKMTPENSECYIVTKDSDIIGKTYETIKNLDIPYIPGSSLKGYALNVLWYDVIKHNQKIYDYILNKLTRINDKYKYDFEKAKNNERFAKDLLKNIAKEVKSVYSRIENEIKTIYNMFGFRDMYFENKIDLYKINRYGLKSENSSLPMCNFEAIIPNAKAKGELYFINNKNAYNSSIAAIDENRKTDEFDKGIYKLFVKEIKERIINFKEWFINANRDYVSDLLKYELEFVNITNNKDVNIDELKRIYNIISTKNTESVIMQIGRNTNYIAKSFSIVFQDKFKTMFNVVFSPAVSSMKMMPGRAGISMMPLFEMNGKGIQPLGFIEVEEW